jgi:hypothetical protein
VSCSVRCMGACLYFLSNSFLALSTLEPHATSLLWPIAPTVFEQVSWVNLPCTTRTTRRDTRPATWHTHTAAPSGPHPEALLVVVLEQLQDVELVVVVRDVRLTAESNEKKRRKKKRLVGLSTRSTPAINSQFTNEVKLPG